jgi:hypothetical protein
LRMQSGSLVLWPKIIRKGNSLFAQGSEFGAAFADDLVFVLRKCDLFVLRCHDGKDFNS